VLKKNSSAGAPRSFNLEAFFLGSDERDLQSRQMVLGGVLRNVFLPFRTPL